MRVTFGCVIALTLADRLPRKPPRSLALGWARRVLSTSPMPHARATSETHEGRPIGPEQRTAFARDGYLVVRGLLSKSLLRETQVGIDALLCARFPELRPSQGDDLTAELHAKLRAAQKRDRPRLGVVYDAIRKLASFWALIGASELQRAASDLLEARTLGVAFRSSGIRLDLPHEDRWRSDWHQEYPSQMISPSGVVAWFPLVPTDVVMGPVRVARGSQKGGLLPIECDDPRNERRDYTRSMRIPGVDAIAARYPEEAPETEPGDVVFLDFMTLHASGFNRSCRTRISCQVRYVDMADPIAVEHGWIGGMHEGGDFSAVHPDKVLPASGERA